MIGIHETSLLYSGKGHTIHSSRQTEWSNNFVDNKSIQVGGKQMIITLDGYIMLVVSKEGFMYLEFIGKPTNEDLASFHLVHLPSPHKCE